MRAINLNNIENLRTEFEGNISVMYGAGGNGERILNIFREHSIKIDFFVDDDHNKWGGAFCNTPIISFEQLTEISKNNLVNVIITSVFAGVLLKKLEKINVQVYEPFAMLISKYYNDSFYKKPLSADKRIAFENKTKFILNKLEDEESKNVIKKICEVVKAPDQMPYTHFFDVASKEDCYFIQEVIDALPKQAVIIDCGGFTGDLMLALDKHTIDYNIVYSFEVNPQLFYEMKHNIVKNSLTNKFIPINKGVWNVSGRANLQVSADDIAGGHVNCNEQGISIDTVTIDEYFKNIHYDFIKMDIEGAELYAVKGGIHTIVENRPIMAISLYHSVDDVVDIPLYLFANLDDYCYLVRHHSYIDSETVLYCIPKEKYYKQNNGI